MLVLCRQPGQRIWCSDGHWLVLNKVVPTYAKLSVHDRHGKLLASHRLPHSQVVRVTKAVSIMLVEARRHEFARLGIDADPDVGVWREELADAAGNKVGPGPDPGNS